MKQRPSLVIFDVNETMFSMGAVSARCVQAGLPHHAADLWFARVLKEAFALECLDTPQPFREVGRLQLRSLLWAHGVTDAESGADHILAGFQELEPYPELDNALKTLQAGGMQICTLTNGHAETTQKLLRRCGLDRYIERCFSVDAVGRWKPDPEPYRHVIEAMAVTPEQAAMVAVHSWDLAGAHRVGLTTGYARRLEGQHLPYYPEPDVQGFDLLEVAEGLCALDG